ncbi:MAG: DinB family protein [Chitinophagales bacterium]|nr:DinB family protein [Chitinophagales bacterium]
MSSIDSLFYLNKQTYLDFYETLNKINLDSKLSKKICEVEEFSTPLNIGIHVLEALNIYSRYISIEIKEKFYIDVIEIHNYAEYMSLSQIINSNFDRIHTKLSELGEEDIDNILIKPKWGGEYDLEMFFEHIIVHNMRHKLQLEKLISN